MKFNIRQVGRKNPRDRPLIRLLKSPVIMASRISTIFLTENANQLCDGTKFLLQEKQAGNNSILINEENIAIIDKLLVYTCISKKKQKKFTSFMFKLIENFEVDKRILKCDYIRYSPAETSTMSTSNSPIHIIIPKKASVISLLNGYLDLNFEVIKKADTGRYGDGNDIRLVILVPIALSSSLKLTTSSGKHLEDISHTHKVSLMYKLKSTAKDTDNLSLCFDQRRNRRRDDLTSNENIKSKYHLRTEIKGVFGFAQVQEKATYGLGYKKPLTRKEDDAVVDKGASSLMLELNLITTIGTCLIKYHSINNKIYYLSRI